MKIFEALALRILSLSHLFKGLNMLKVVHASWPKKSWIENNSRKDTVEIRETERIEHGETKEERMFAAFLRATMTFRKCVQSCGWRAVGWIDALRFEIERKKPEES